MVTCGTLLNLRDAKKSYSLTIEIVAITIINSHVFEQLFRLCTKCIPIFGLDGACGANPLSLGVPTHQETWLPDLEGEGEGEAYIFSDSGAREDIALKDGKEHRAQRAKWYRREGNPRAACPR